MGDVPVRPRTLVTLTSLTGTFPASILSLEVKSCALLGDSEESQGARDDKAAFRRTKGNREDVWVDMRAAGLNFGDEAPGNFTRRIRARVLQLSFAKNSSAFS